MKTKLILLLLTAIAIQTAAYSQVTLEWAARYKPAGSYSYANVDAMALDSMGNVIVSGQDSEMPYGFVTVKFNSSGQFVWATRYSGGMPIRATPVSIAVDTDGNIYIGAVDNDYIVIKYDSAGVQQWAKEIQGRRRRQS
ncbi:SBBP repeat-containing protein [Bacteroidota bacterium]